MMPATVESLPFSGAEWEGSLITVLMTAAAENDQFELEIDWKLALFWLYMPHRLEALLCAQNFFLVKA